MRICLMIIGIFTYTVLSNIVFAQPPQAATPQSQSATAPSQNTGKKLNVDRFLAELDVNKDGCISQKEWVGAGLPEFHFQTLSAQAEKSDCVTKKEMLIGNPPDGIDINGDGYLTVAEMIEYTKKTSGGGSGGGAPGGAPPGK
jgi:hypothetical protein